MELDYAILAEKADRTQDGKLVVLGGDIDSVTITTLPAVFPVSLVARIFLRPDEELEGHTFGIEATSSKGTRTTVAEDVPLQARRNPIEPDQPSPCRLILNLNLVVNAPGQHFIHLMLDREEVRAIRFRVDVQPQPEERH